MPVGGLIDMIYFRDFEICRLKTEDRLEIFQRLEIEQVIGPELKRKLKKRRIYCPNLRLD